MSTSPADSAPVIETQLSEGLAVRPTPTDEELAAIMASIEVAWPRPVVLLGDDDEPNRWRFSGRWWSKPVPARRRRS